MFYYYVDQQIKNYYKWGTNDQGAPEFYHLYDNQWTPLPIKGKKKTDQGWEYDLGKINSTQITLNTFNNSDRMSLSFFTPPESGLLGTTRFIPLYLINKDLVPFQKETVKIPVETLSQNPAHSSQPNSKLKTYSLTPKQIERLEQHKEMLKGRCFERRIHDYLFFCQGRTRTEKIREITKLLHGEACDPEVIEQGRTGKIVKG
ncbi:hypothetical protein OQJ13_10525 [Legionella sp. PATHC035]|uniref:hypothetical protein n=1 Tax=Legionella sp. PATHC035 TaxID=2992040 RepID=UPI0022432591|nr:hypothetical protein [Legionella sp. PATHC035]MCW8409409.1 hypothetical protein [Legionella sp. PATHC035]